MICIEVGDNRFFASNGKQSLESCGYALLRKPLLLGDEARSSSRLFPKELNNNYWQDLSQAALNNRYNYAASAADIAWHQLKSTLENIPGEGLVLVTPAHYSEAQLSLLLGITNSLQKEVLCLVSRPLLLSAAAAPPRRRAWPV